MDTLATALYATTDDILKEHPDLAPWRPPVGIAPHIEVVVTRKARAWRSHLALRRRMGRGLHPGEGGRSRETVTTADLSPLCGAADPRRFGVCSAPTAGCRGVANADGAAQLAG